MNTSHKAAKLTLEMLSPFASLSGLPDVEPVAPPAKTAAQIFAELEAAMEQVTQKHIAALHLAFAKAEAAHKIK